MRKTVGRWTDGTANDFGFWHSGEPNDWGTLPDGSEGAVCDCSLGLGGCATGHGSVQDLAHGGEDCVIARKGALGAVQGAVDPFAPKIYPPNFLEPSLTRSIRSFSTGLKESIRYNPEKQRTRWWKFVRAVGPEWQQNTLDWTERFYSMAGTIPQ